MNEPVIPLATLMGQLVKNGLKEAECCGNCKHMRDARYAAKRYKLYDCALVGDRAFVRPTDTCGEYKVKPIIL